VLRPQHRHSILEPKKDHRAAEGSAVIALILWLKDRLSDVSVTKGNGSTRDFASDAYEFFFAYQTWGGFSAR
jgi:hypothetical protein